MLDQWLLLNAIGYAYKLKLKELLNFYGQPERILKLGSEDLLKSNLVDKGFVQALELTKKKFNLKKEYQLIEKYNVKVLTLHDEDYPMSLRYIPDAPVLLYVSGSIKKEDIFSIGIVGTRHFTHYGKQMATLLSGQLAQQGVSIISGLARGIDTFAHRAALEVKGRTIGVLGSGIGQFYPPENRSLARDIITDHGAVISEFSMDEQPSKITFPLRNRIISGLSLGTLVIEADEKSGALITAKWAMEQGREVFAVPGNVVSRYSKGTNRLIKDGAKLVEDCEDIIEEISCLKKLLGKKKKPAPPKEAKIEFTPQEEGLYQHITAEPINIEMLSEKSGLPINQLASLLLQLEMKEVVQELSGKNYIRIA